LNYRPVGEETTEALFYLAKFVEKVSLRFLVNASARDFFDSTSRRPLAADFFFSVVPPTSQKESGIKLI